MDSNVWTVGVAGLKTRIPWVSRLSRGAAATGWYHLAPDQKTTGNSPNCKSYVQQRYDVVLTLSSYYSLFEEAGISWKKHRNVIPKKTQNWSKKKDRDYRLVRSPSLPRLSLGSWWSSSSMNATCYGAISAAMFEVKLMSASSSHHQWTQQTNLLWSR